ncbi:hypothetical protein OS493_006468 [Desmophyllum pertusum]|uniref:Urease accessory protein D n=1 Tax=Desmophyllum pertusum TaxID=174260 RepID=A0A9X0A4V5_9CNID|nr:hypothetical protein OS493_006468 [Desmophyllum pertusum]
MERAAAEFCCILETVPGVDGTETVKLKTVNSKLYFTNPLRLLVRQPHSRHCSPNYNCQWLYKLYSGGRVLDGSTNCTSLEIGVGEDCNVVFTTQEYPKISASDTGLVMKQELRVRVADRAILAVLPDPFLCYKNSMYQQDQVYNLTTEGNLILLDWLIAGRIALGEVWDMTSFVSQSKIYVDGKLVLGDAINLDRYFGNNGKRCSLRESLQHTKVLGSCVFIGPYFKDLKWTIQDKVHEISGREGSDGITASVSVLNQPLCDGVVIKLLGAQSTEQARSFFRRLVEDTTTWFGGDPLDK